MKPTATNQTFLNSIYHFLQQDDNLDKLSSGQALTVNKAYGLELVEVVTNSQNYNSYNDYYDDQETGIVVFKYVGVGRLDVIYAIPYVVSSYETVRMPNGFPYVAEQKTETITNWVPV